MKRAFIEEAARQAGLELSGDTDVTVDGDDPVHPSPYHVGGGVSTALALAGQEASRIWELRGGTPQSLAIDLRHAATILRGYIYLTIDGQRPPLEERPGVNLSRIWKCADGRFIQLHNSFVDAPKTLAELGLDERASADDVAAVVAKRDSWELEDALAKRGVCGCVCRTADEWLAHPQGALLATKPVVEVTRIGDAPPEPFSPAPRPLTGVRVLDLTRVLAGPVCGRTLAEHGADVLHIVGPNLPAADGSDYDTGHGKRQAFLDLANAEGVDRLRDLTREADVFVQNFRHGSLERRGLGAADLAALRPGLVHVSLNAYGHDGPWAQRPGWEQLGQACSGVALGQGIDRGRVPPWAMNDYTTGIFGALGTMMALRRRALEGGSWSVRVSLAQTAMWYTRLGNDVDFAGANGSGDVSAFMQERDTPYGRMYHLAPALRMSKTPPQWELPSAPPGSHAPEWLPRA